MMDSCNTDDLDAFIRNPEGRRYWTKPRRDVIYRIFRQEILDPNLTLPSDKVAQAINELAEERSRQMHARVRAFIYRIRKDRMKILETGKRHLTPKKRRQRKKKTLVESSTPLINSNESAYEGTGTHFVTPASSVNEIDKCIENIDGSEWENEKKKANPDSHVQPLNESNELYIMECDKDETKSDPVDLSLNKKCKDFENNEVSLSPRKNTTCCPPGTKVSVLENHVAQELFSSYLSSETVKVDFVTDFLKSRGFENITRETVFTWADAFSNGVFDHNPGLLFNEMTECLVSGVVHGGIDLKFILESYTESSDLSELSFENINHTKVIPLGTSSSILSDEGNRTDDLRTLDLSPIKEQVVDEPMRSENEGTMDDTETPDVSPTNDKVIDTPISSENEDSEVRKMNLRERKKRLDFTNL